MSEEIKMNIEKADYGTIVKFGTLKDLYEKDKDGLKDYTKVLYSQARLIEGLPIENPTEISNLICNLISK